MSGFGAVMRRKVVGHRGSWEGEPVGTGSAMVLTFGIPALPLGMTPVPGVPHGVTITEGDGSFVTTETGYRSA